MGEEEFQAELAELGERITISLSYNVNKSAVQLKHWHALFPDISPKQLCGYFAGITPDDRDVAIELDCLGYEESRKPAFDAAVMIIRHMPHVSGSEQGFLKFHLPMTTTSAKELYLEMAKFSQQSVGLARHYMAAMLDFSRDMGYDSMALGANNVGAYAWAKFGFCPATERGWEKLKQDISERIDDFSRKAVHRDAAKGKAMVFRAPLELAVLREIFEAEFDDLPKVFPMIADFNRVIQGEGGIHTTVGKALLINQRWSGVLPLQDGHPSFERFKSYVAPATEQTKAHEGGRS